MTRPWSLIWCQIDLFTRAIFRIDSLVSAPWLLTPVNARRIHAFAYVIINVCAIFRLFRDAILSGSGVFEGETPNLTFTHDITKIIEHKYHDYGKMIAWILLQGGPGLHGLAPAVYRYWTGLPVLREQLVPELVNDFDLRKTIIKVSHNFIKN